MEDLIVQIQSIPVKPEDVVLLTFSKDMDINECTACVKSIREMCPNLNLIPNREDIIKNITILDMPYNYSTYFDQEGLPI